MTRDEILRENKRGGGMFAVIPSVVMLDEELPPSAKLLYGAITWRSGKYGFCWATNELLGADVGISGKRVSALVALLETRGHIETETLLNPALSGGKQRNIYPVVKSARGMAGGMLKNEDTLSSEMSTQYAQKRVDGMLKNEDQKKKNKYININPPYNPPKGTRRAKSTKSTPTWKPERFEGFWAYYPRGENRMGAVRAWDRLRPDDALIDEIGRSLQILKASRAWQDGVGIPYASTFLNQRRWEDADAKRPAQRAWELPARRIEQPPDSEDGAWTWNE